MDRQFHAAGFVVGHEAFEETPEVAGVVVVDKVAEFVGDDVFGQAARGHQNLPVDGDLALAVATAPAFGHVADQ